MPYKFDHLDTTMIPQCGRVQLVDLDQWSEIRRVYVYWISAH